MVFSAAAVCSAATPAPRICSTSVSTRLLVSTSMLSHRPSRVVQAAVPGNVVVVGGRRGSRRRVYRLYVRPTDRCVAYSVIMSRSRYSGILLVCHAVCSWRRKTVPGNFWGMRVFVYGVPLSWSKRYRTDTVESPLQNKYNKTKVMARCFGAHALNLFNCIRRAFQQWRAKFVSKNRAELLN